VNQTKMRIVLKKDWDININHPTNKGQVQGYFVGRDKELRLLVNEILRRNSGAILISGYRGVGKTSLVYKALWEAKKGDENIIIVLLNAAQLEAEMDESEESKIHPRKIIENLIRRLYSSTKGLKLPGDIKEEVTKLYKKAVAKEFKLLEGYQSKQELSQQIMEEKMYEILLDEKNVKIMIFLISWTVAVTFQFIPLTPWDYLNKILPLILAFPLPFTLNLWYKKKIDFKKLKEDIEKTEELYEFDSSIGNLEFDLEQLHRKFKENGKKLIYVIDELDKLEPDLVIEVLKFFKNLFTLSDAIFIFIGGEEIYDFGERSKEGKKSGDEKSKEDIYRPKEYTYFTSKYFLCRPLWEDLSRFFDEITEIKEIDDKNFEILKRAIAFEARNDFFDLIKFIKDRITDFDQDNRPIIKLDNLPEEDIKKARFHKAITVLFESKYINPNPSKWLENESILRKLFEHAHNIYSSYSGYQITDPDKDRVEDEAIRYFNEFLYRHGAFNVQNETSVNIRGVAVPIRTYQYMGTIPSEIPDKIDELAEFEKRFINNFENYAKYILALINAFRIAQKQEELTEGQFWREPVKYVQQIKNWGFDTLSQFNANYPVYLNLVSRKPPYPYKREDIENRTKQIENHTNTMLQNLPNITSRMLVSLNAHMNLQIQHLQQNNSLFSGSANQIRNALNNFNPLVIFKPDLSRQIIIIYNQLSAVLSVKSKIKDNSKTHRIVCFSPKKERSSEGLHILYTKDPESLKEELVVLFKDLNEFLKE